VHYKLDLGIDHVLIDEAQDTSAKQWEIVRAARRRIRGRPGRARVTRSIFAVGDEKQSIFSFQGAASRTFADSGARFGAAFEARTGIRRREFKHSFRSGAIVLGAVDTVFSARSLPQRDDATRRRSAAHGGARTVARLVELWPMIEPDEKPRSRAGTRRSTRARRRARA
jgi:ATP-dependent helicase/nuclease subunit A